jgi:hypothetical protein
MAALRLSPWLAYAVILVAMLTLLLIGFQILVILAWKVC